MNNVLKKVIEKVRAVEGKSDFLDVLFGSYKEQALNSIPVVMFGAGALGKEMLYALKLHGINPVCFCDNNAAKQGETIESLPVISFEELAHKHRDSFVVLAVSSNVRTLTKQLKSHGFDLSKVFRKETDPDSELLVMYSMVGSQSLHMHYKNTAAPDSILEKLIAIAPKVKEAHDTYSDEKSKELFISKLAVFASDMHFALFKEFMLLFSEPIHKFGMLNYQGTPEDYFYFNNDVLSISENEIYIDVGAFDGDSIETFVQACSDSNLDYEYIYGIEPDPDCYSQLERNFGTHENVSLHQIGLWSKSMTLEFIPSSEAIHEQAGTVVGAGSVQIKALTLDDFLDGKKVTFIKMDPSCDVEAVMMGAEKTIHRNKPKLALGIYHSLEEFIHVPIFIKKVCPEYQLFLRHNTYHLCDTDLYGYV